MIEFLSMKIHDSVYCFDGELELFKNFYLPVRSTVLRLNSGDGVMISPIAFTIPEWAQIKAQFSIKHIIAPCTLHHVFVKSAHSQLPQAQLWGAPGLTKKRADISWDFELLPQNWTLAPEIQIIPLAGGTTHEVVFYHRDSKTLVVIDLLFNLHNRPGWKSYVIQKMFGTWNKPAVSRWFKTTIKDKKLFQQSMAEILALDFKTLIMSHGDIIYDNAKEILKNALIERKLI